MEATETIALIASLLGAAIVIPLTAIALHQRKRRAFERRAGMRRKEKIRL
ncbi:MAG: hypothetical protein QOG72_2943 [Sphingomonadales bacterium]|nr:hypothetical protein [Sphingomonadales bacterium]